jgi:outer membrane protein assembly factor BamB
MRRPLPLLTLTLLLTTSWPAAISAEDYWPGWLGPTRNGWVKNFQPPDRWPAQLKQSWQVDVGSGYGSPVVSKGQVYLHTRQADNEVVWCLDIKNGKVKWRQDYAAPFKIGGGGEYHGKGPKSCPLLADGRLFTLSIAGILTAWDAASGKRLWQQDYSARYKQGHPYWGATTSPIADGKRVIVHFGGDDEGALVALDSRTGKQIWSHGKDGASYSSPLLVEIEGVRQIVEWNHRALVGVDSTSGRSLWEYAFPHVGTDQNMPTPTFHQGVILLGGENRGIHGLKPRRDGDSWRVEELWHQDKLALDMSSAVINGDLLYGFSHYDKGRLFCLDSKTGEILWQGPGRTGVNATFLSVSGYVLALIDNGELQVIRASGSQFEKAASYRVTQNASWAPPVLLSDGILVKDVKTLTMWSLSSE